MCFLSTAVFYLFMFSASYTGPMTVYRTMEECLYWKTKVKTDLGRFQKLEMYCLRSSGMVEACTLKP